MEKPWLMEDATAAWEGEGGAVAPAEKRLIGTVNQVAWAEQIKANVSAEFDRVAKLTGIPAANIVSLAREYATTRPAVIRVNYGVQRSERGGLAVQAISLLPGPVPLAPEGGAGKDPARGSPPRGANGPGGGPVALGAWKDRMRSRL